MKIKICEENKDKINEEIAIIEGKATARTCNFEDVVKLVDFAEKHLINFYVPKKYWNKFQASYCEKIGCGSYADKYYSANTTEISITRGSKDWFLTDVKRIEINPRDAKNGYSVKPTSEIIDIVREKAVENFIN